MLRRFNYFVIIILFVLLPSCVHVELDGFLQDRAPLFWMPGYIINKFKTRVASEDDLLRVREFLEANSVVTPLDLQRAIRQFKYIPEEVDTIYDAAAFLERGGGDCDDWTLFVCRCLKELGYESFFVFAISEDGKRGHAFAFFVNYGKIFIFTPYYYVITSFDKGSQAVDWMGYYYFYVFNPNVD